MRKRIASIVLSVCLCLTLLPTAALAEVEGESTSHTHCLCGSTHTIIGDHTTENEITFTAWTFNNYLPISSGYYYLTDDLTLDKSLNEWTPAKGTVLCLNGHTITSQKDRSVITIDRGRTFTLTDCKSDNAQGKVTHDSNALSTATRGVFVNGTFNMYGGKITGNKSNQGGGVNVSGGVFNLYGGSIVGNSTTGNGGVYVYRGSFTMSGGTISNNTASGNGGGVYMETRSKFIMSGGKIAENTAGGNGAGVYMDSSQRSITLSGDAQITGNTKTGNSTASNIYLSSGNTITLTETGFTGLAGITTAIAPTVPAPVQVLSGSEDYSSVTSKFTSDVNTKYHVNDSGKLVVDRCTGCVYENGVCTVCGYICPHSNVDANNKCGECESAMIAKVEHTEGDTITGYYASLNAAIEAAKAGDTITLLANVNESVACTFKNITLDLNGKTLSSLAVSGTAIKVKDSVGGGNITLTTSNGVNVFDLLEAGYAFKDDNSNWYDSTHNETATGVTNAEVKPVPMTGVSIATADNTTLVYGYADAPAFTAAPTGTADGASVTYTWYVDNDKQIEIGSSFTFPTGKSVTAYKVKCDAAVDGYVMTSDEITVTVNTATPTVTTAPTAAVTYGDKVKDTDISGGEMSVDGTFKWKDVSTYGDATNGTPKTLTAIFTPTDATNYSSVDVPVSVTVEKTTYGDQTASGSAKYGHPGGVDLSGLIMSGGTATASVKSDTDKVLSGMPTMDGSKLSFAFHNDASLVNKTATVTVNVAGCTNYKNYTITVTVTVNAKATQDTLTISADKTTVTYGETVTLSSSGGSGDGEVTYTITNGSASIIDGNELKPANADPVMVIASKVGNATYADANSEPITITVNKATVTVTAIDRSIYVNGTAPDLSNPVKGTDYTVTGLVGADTLGGTITMKYQKDGSTVATPDVATTGSYDIVISSATADSTKYNDVVFKNGTLTISNRPSSGGGSSSKPTVTVPISSDHATVEVKAEVSKGNATVEVSDKQIDKVIADHAGEVTIDVSGLKNVDSATVPSHVVEKTNEAENTGLTVALPAGSVKLDETALGSVTENANGKDVTVSVVAVPTEKLPTAVKDIIGMEPTVVAVVDVNVTISGKKQSGFDGGKVTISVPYTPKKGEDTGKLTVWFIRDDGTIENKGGYYDAKNKCFVFETDHLSQYILVNTNEMMSFTDVPTDAYFANAVNWAAGKGITGGVDATHFMPNNACTRAQIVTFLWRAAGSPEPKAASSFTDVSADAYYAKAVAWAVENGITGGIGNNQFAPDLTCTRAQAAAFLFRYAAANGMDFVTLQELVGGYGDAAQVPGYAISAFNWALAKGIVNGNNGNLMPNNDCTRAQIVTMLYRLLGTN